MNNHKQITGPKKRKCWDLSGRIRCTSRATVCV